MTTLNTRTLTTSQQILIMAALNTLHTTATNILEKTKANNITPGQATLTAQITDIENLHTIIANALSIHIEEHENTT